MPSSTSFIPSDQSLKLAVLIAQLKASPKQIEQPETDEFYKKVAALIQSDKRTDVLKLFAKESKVLLTVEDKDLEGVYNLLIALLKDAKGDALILELIKDTVDPFLQAPKNQALTKLKILGNLFNNIETPTPSPKSKKTAPSPALLHIFKAIMTLSSKGDELDMIFQQPPNKKNDKSAVGNDISIQVDHWIKLCCGDDGDASLKSVREMYLFVADCLATDEKYQIQSYEYKLKYLSTFNTPTCVGEVDKKVMIETIKQAIKDPRILNFEDLIKLNDNVFVKNNTDAKLMEMLGIFYKHGLVEYNAYHKKNGDFIKNQGFVHEELKRKIRLLTFATLACTKVPGDITYSDIAKALEIEVGAVELWVIDVIRAGLVDARMNQLEQIIHVTRSTPREFGKKEWDLLDSKIDQWSGNLDKILEVITNAKLNIAANVEKISEF